MGRGIKKHQIARFFKEREGDMTVLIDTVATVRRGAFKKLEAVQEEKKAQLLDYFSAMRNQGIGKRSQKARNMNGDEIGMAEIRAISTVSEGSKKRGETAPASPLPNLNCLSSFPTLSSSSSTR